MQGSEGRGRVESDRGGINAADRQVDKQLDREAR